MPNLYLVGFLALVLAAFYGDYKYTQHQNSELKTAASEANTKISNLEATAKAQSIIDDANRESSRILSNSHVQSAIDKQKRTDKADENAVSETAKRDADEYTEFTERVMQKNFDLIQCKSDYRNIGKDEKTCIGHVR